MKRSRAGGSTTPMERVRILDPRPDRAAVKQTYDRAVELLPALGHVGVANA